MFEIVYTFDILWSISLCALWFGEHTWFCKETNSCTLRHHGYVTFKVDNAIICSSFRTPSIWVSATDNENERTDSDSNIDNNLDHLCTAKSKLKDNIPGFEYISKTGHASWLDSCKSIQRISAYETLSLMLLFLRSVMKFLLWVVLWEVKLHSSLQVITLPCPFVDRNVITQSSTNQIHPTKILWTSNFMHMQVYQTLPSSFVCEGLDLRLCKYVYECNHQCWVALCSL